MASLTNLAHTGANNTYPLYLINDTSPVPIGLQAWWGGTGSLYLSARLLAVRARVNFVNQEAFGLRAAIALTTETPANNALNQDGTQQPFLSRVSSMSTDKVIGPLTGDGMTTLSLQASNARNLGVRNVRGLSDAYTNSWNSTTDALVPATSGLVLIVMTAATTNLTAAGVITNVEADMQVEFFNPSPIKQT
jgi:hypothetical protein